MIAALPLLYLAVAAGQSPTIIRQTTTGWCSPIISNVTGNVTVNCNGVDPRALKRLNAQLAEKRQELAAKMDEADDWAERYHELEARLTEPGPDSALFRQAKEYLHEGEFDKANEILDRILDEDEQKARELAAHQYVKGLAEQIRFRPVEALAHYEKAYRFRPENPAYGLKYAQFLVRENEYRKAAPVLEDTLKHAREIVAQHPNVNSPGLARILVVQGGLYRETKQYQLAEKDDEEALGIYREAAKAKPEQYDPRIANLLSSLGRLYERTKRLDQCEVVYRQAVALARTLPATPLNRDYLAVSLNNLATLLVQTQRLPEAQEAIDESAKIARELAQAKPAAYEPDLVRILGNVSLVYDGGHRFKEAEQAAREGLEISRRLAEANPDAYLPDKAVILSLLGTVLKDEDRHEDAQAAYRSAIEIDRTLAKRDAEVYEPMLAQQLNQLAMEYAECKKVPEAKDTFRESIALHRRLLQNDLDEWGLGTALGLRYLALKANEDSDFPQAEALYRETVEVYRRLAERDPGRYEPYLASCLESLGFIYLELHDPERARRAAKDGAEILGRLAASDRVRYGDQLAACLFTESQAARQTDPAQVCDLLQRASDAAYSSKMKEGFAPDLQECRDRHATAEPR